MDQRRWSDLVPDVLREISSRLCFGSATDFVCFHAVCKPWRNSCDPLSRRKTTTQFPPCLLPAANNVSADLRLTCIFSNLCCRARCLRRRRRRELEAGSPAPTAPKSGT
ncbi:hypothetical protein QYE76_058336 [Lolium multiflorum]|uniref:F-box domain-containing protein n=1 Tax=Lolium multiflorum TaxID=4521 RepID=A0AAD8WPT2_LOLMU|nr:hypothetical protein QYE76_058336 [Lolium multiflorum]